MADSVSSQRL